VFSRRVWKRLGRRLFALTQAGGVKTLSGTVLLLIAALGACGHRMTSAQVPSEAARQACTYPTTVPVTSAVFDESGRLWRARVIDGNVLVAKSEDVGNSFSPEVRVNSATQAMWADREDRPRIAVDGRGVVHVAYVELIGPRKAARIRYARSTNAGRSFEAAVIVNDDQRPFGQRCPTMAVSREGEVWIAWLDERDQVVVRREGESHVGAALFFAYSVDGQRFGASIRVAGQVCDRCRVGLGMGREGVPVAFWQQVLAGAARGYAAALLQRDATLTRVSDGAASFVSCSSEGPFVLATRLGVRHFAWVDTATDRQRIGYARHVPGRHPKPPLRIGDPQRQPSHPALLSIGVHVFLVWKEHDGEVTRVMLSTSADDGQHWSEARDIAATRAANDPPLLLTDGRRAYLSWAVAGLPYRLQSISGVERK
jgi:hypothetical protein